MKSSAMKRLAPFLPWLVHSFIFNLHYFRFRDAIKLPVLLMRPRFVRLGGSVRIEGRIRSGMIRIGHKTTSIFPGERVRMDLNGTLVFKGECQISNGSAIVTGSKSILSFGNQVNISDKATIICFHRIELGDYFNMSWQCTLCDNDFHALTDAETGKKNIPFAPIKIGDHCWMGQHSTILKGVELPAFVTIQAQSLVCRRIQCTERSIIGGNPAQILSSGKYYRNFQDDTPEYIYPQM